MSERYIMANTNGTSGGNDTEDKLFLLSIDEVYFYFPSAAERICYVTPYAACEGSWTDFNDGCCWWLRSPGSGNAGAADIYSDGKLWGSVVDISYQKDTVRPVMWITIGN